MPSQGSFFFRKNPTGQRRPGICGKKNDSGMGEVVLAAEAEGALRRCLFGLLAGRREENIFSNDLQCMAAGYCGFASSLKKKKAPVNPLPTTPHPFLLRSTPFLIQLLYSLLLATAKVNGLLASRWSACLVFDHYDCISQSQSQSRSQSHLTTSHSLADS
jgi:hypothetical protein